METRYQDSETNNLELICRSGRYGARIDNTGGSDVGAVLNDLIERHWGPGGIDIFLAPGIYLLETPIVIRHSNIALQGYTFGFAYPSPKRPIGQTAGREGKTTLLVGPSCRDAIQIGPVRERLAAFTLRNISICGQNGRIGARPNITPEQNGIRFMPNTFTDACVVDYCQLTQLTHGILNEHPESTMDVLYITDNWIAECNVAIKLHASAFCSVISRNGFHDMSGTVFELRSTNHVDYATKEMVLSDNTGWNPGKLVFDLEGFRGGTVCNNAFMFNHELVQCFARLASCHMTHVTGNTFVVDGTGPHGIGFYGTEGHAMGYEEDGERLDTLTMLGCADCTVSGNSLINFNAERPTIRLDGHRRTGEKSRHNNVMLNKMLPTTGFEGRPWIELTSETEGNLLLLPVAEGEAASRTVRDQGTGNQICALSPIAGYGVV